MENSQTFFSKVTTRKERERVFSLVVQSKSEVEIQTASKQIISLKADHLKDAQLILFNSIDKFSIPFKAIVSFNIGSEKYFMKSTLSGHDLKNHYTLDISEPIFKLQRRNSFRIQIPIDYHAKLKILELNGKPISRTYTLADLSGGGFAIEIKPNIEFNLQKGDMIFCEMEIGGKFKKSVYAIAKHIVKVGSSGSGLVRCGMEFQNIKNHDQQAIVSLVMDLYRDMFSKFKIGTR